MVPQQLSQTDWKESARTRSGLETIENCIEKLEEKEFEREDIFLLGFSQGACLVTEYAARNPKRFKAVIGYSGGLIGPEGNSVIQEI